MLTLYDSLSSGNGYKARLLLAQLGIPFVRIEKDVVKGETRTAEFLALNPNGRVPLLELGDGRLLPESGAILYYIADIALYAYTHVADEGDFDLARYPNVRAWLARVAAEPGHVPITHG